MQQERSSGTDISYFSERISTLCLGEKLDLLDLMPWRR